MQMHNLIFVATALVMASIAGLAILWAQNNPVSDPDPERYAHQIAEFAKRDELAFPRLDSIVFVGSSSIRRWDLVEQFPDLPTVNRGFGGSQISDVNHYIDDVVLKYDPSIVVLYVGENDISGRKSANQLLEGYRRFVKEVTEHSTETDIIYLSIKPSPKRMASWSEMSAANEKIRTFSACYQDYHFVDVSKFMLNANGEPKPLLYVEDGIHMTAAGYDIWTSLLEPVLDMAREN